MGRRANSFFKELVEAMVIRPRRIETKPKIARSSFGADLANAFLLHPIHQEPVQKPSDDQQKRAE